jgi:hypothetical protein
VVRKIGLSQNMETRDCGLKIVVYPKTSHGIVNSGVDHHGCLIRIITCDAFIHLKEVTVFARNHLYSISINSVSEVEVDCLLRWAHTQTFITAKFCLTRRNISRSEVTERWVNALKVVISLILWDVMRFAIVTSFLRNPNSAIVSKGFGHEGEL